MTPTRASVRRALDLLQGDDAHKGDAEASVAPAVAAPRGIAVQERDPRGFDVLDEDRAAEFSVTAGVFERGITAKDDPGALEGGYCFMRHAPERTPISGRIRVCEGNFSFASTGFQASGSSSLGVEVRVQARLA